MSADANTDKMYIDNEGSKLRKLVYGYSEWNT